ncbi:hypothetical protein DVH05_016597 [Phytophthora capsici]|nr:hypothetical protein DVH05_016597 [Phytophthora capsici]
MKKFGWGKVTSPVVSPLVAPTADTSPKRELVTVSKKKPTPVLERSLTRDETLQMDLFDWPIDLLEAQKKTIDSSKAGLLAGVGGCLDDLLALDSTTLKLKEFSQFLNPIIQSELRAIKRIYQQPAVTRADQDRLRSYKKNYQKAALQTHGNKTNVGDNVFKLDYDANLKTEYPYRVRYASESIPYDKVIAITYAWHETKRKHKEFRVTGQRKPIELGVEWDVEVVLQTLAELSKHNWIWMDQFSLDKDKVTTTALCSDIPTIYRNARVVAFLPFKICAHLSERIDKFRRQVIPNVSAALAEMMLHDLVCECTDGLYGWLSRLWTWQELMLASSLRFVWGLGVSQWTRHEIFKEGDQPEGDREAVLSRALGVIGDAGKKVKHVVKRSVTNISVHEQPITRLLNELTKRNTKSVIIPEADTATLSMGYYLCMRLLCGAEVYMPSASQIPPIDCLKVLQQIASTGRKGGRLYDCYYAAGAFFKDATFLPAKKKFKKTGDQQANHDNDDGECDAKPNDGAVNPAEIESTDVKEELELRAAYFGLYERECYYQSLPEKYRTILDNREVLRREYEALLEEYTGCYAKKYKQSLELIEDDIGGLRKAFADLYHDIHNTPLVKHCGVPVPSTSAPKDEDSMDNFHPLAWSKKSHSHRTLERLNSSKKEQEEKKMKSWNLIKSRQKAATNEKKDSKDGFLNAFVLSGMNEEAFYETQHCEVRGEVCVGTAYDIQSLKTIKVGGTLDLCFASIYKIIANMHPSQLTRARNFNSIPTEMNMSLYPIAHAIIHATCYSNEEHPAHLAHVVSGLLSSRITAEAYVNAVALLVGEGFDFILDEKRDRKNQFKLVKITLSDGTRCVGIVSKLLKNSMANALVKSASASDSKELMIAREKHFTAGKKLLDGTAASKATAATRNFVKKSMRVTSVSEAVSGTRKFVKKSVDEVGKTTIKAVAATETFVKESVDEVSTSTKTFVKESGEAAKQYVTKKLTAATIASSLTKASIKVVKSHHRLLLCSGGDTDVSDWNVVGYIPGFDAEANKAVLGPISHSGVQLKLNTAGDDSSVAPSA